MTDRATAISTWSRPVCPSCHGIVHDAGVASGVATFLCQQCGQHIAVWSESGQANSYAISKGEFRRIGLTIKGDGAMSGVRLHRLLGYMGSTGTDG